MEAKWSLRQLREQVDKMVFERMVLTKLPPTLITEGIAKHTESPNPDLVFKTSYVLDFLNLPQIFSEAELE